MQSTPNQQHLAPKRSSVSGRRAACSFLLAFATGMSFTVVSAASPANPASPVVTDTGSFIGVPSPSAAGVDVFFGIRYAAAPEGALRWTPPQSPAAPAAPVVAAIPGPACPQPASTAPLPQSEDCLFLNVYASASQGTHAKRPVFVWIHGGALITGSGAIYDPSAMVADNDIVVVTINYRLGALGWLVEPGLVAAESSFFQNAGDAGNYGLMDQQFALQWVQRNIAAFGGDPQNVTVGGESAGGLSVTSNLTSTTTAKGLFRGAIIESGAYMLHDLPSQAAYGAIFGAGFDAALGCSASDEAACLRAAPVASVLAAQSAVFSSNGISPDFGTRVLPRALKDALSQGEFFRVPVLQGTNANEGRLFEPGEIPFASTLPNIQAAGGPANFDLTNANTFCATPQGTGAPVICSFPQEVGLYLGALSVGLGFPTTDVTPSLVKNVLEEYPLAHFPDPFLPHNAPSADEALSQIFTDAVFACNGSDSNLDLARFVPVFGYEFNDPNAPPLGSVPVRPPNDVFGFPSASEHSAELQFLFNFDAPLSAGEQELASQMQTYWANFVISKDPNLPRHVPVWLPFNILGIAQALVPGPRRPQPFLTFRQEHFCGTWEPIVSAEVGL
jgi:para-nitrobenzyl esterase